MNTPISKRLTRFIQNQPSFLYTYNKFDVEFRVKMDGENFVLYRVDGTYSFTHDDPRVIEDEMREIQPLNKWNLDTAEMMQEIFAMVRENIPAQILATAEEYIATVPTSETEEHAALVADVAMANEEMQEAAKLEHLHEQALLGNLPHETFSEYWKPAHHRELATIEPLMASEHFLDQIQVALLAVGNPSAEWLKAFYARHGVAFTQRRPTCTGEQAQAMLAELQEIITKIIARSIADDTALFVAGLYAARTFETYKSFRTWQGGLCFVASGERTLNPQHLTWSELPALVKALETRVSEYSAVKCAADDFTPTFSK